jgi:hypothetical protein
MKKIYLLVMLLTVVVAAQAQRNLKLAMVIRNPTREMNIKTGDVVSPIYVIKNVGTTAADSVAAGDTIWYQTPANTATQLSGVILGKGIKPGDSAVLNVTSLSSLSLPFANIKTFINPALSGYETPAYAANTRHLWYVFFDTVTGKVGAPAIATVNKTIDTVGVWINKTTAGIDEFANQQNETISTYPNPAATQLSFAYNFLTNADATATIVDLTGRTVLTKSFANNSGAQQFHLDINSLSNGVYFLHFVVGAKTMVNKFTVQK